MPKKSPKQSPQTSAEASPTATPKGPSISVKKQQPLPPDAVKRMVKFYQDSREEERLIWRSIHG